MSEDVVVVKRNELYPKKPTVKEDECPDIPIRELPGENVECVGRSLSDDVIAITNYRLCLFRKSRIVINVPVRLIESVTQCDSQELLFNCKHAASFRVAFANTEKAQKWLVQVNGKTAAPTSHKELFAYSHWAWAKDLESLSQGHLQLVANNHVANGRHVIKTRSRLESENQFYSITNEYQRLGFSGSSAWKMTDINSDYRLCKSYPKLHIVPQTVSSKDLEETAKFRSSGRFPSIVWRHQGNGVVLARCSQPLLGWFSWRSNQDEEMLKAISDACLRDQKHILSMRQVRGETCSDSEANRAPRLLIVDARSYSAAVANRTKGGGCECKEYYANSDIKFMNLPNIHAVRKSFQSVCNLCTLSADASSWLSSVESSQWLQYVSQTMQAAGQVVKALHRDCRPVLVHCSDGWDRTPQLTSLAEIMLDPFYRTVPGFIVLVEREWLSFGHKFGSRCGHKVGDADSTQRCPVFLQWLDCIHQLLLQFPTAFGFNEAFLMKLAVHTYSCLYGTFLYNCAQEREQQKETTLPVWSLLSNDNVRFANLLYKESNQVLVPDCHIRRLQLWTSLYCISHYMNPGTLETDQLEVIPGVSGPRSLDPMSLPTSPITASPARLTRSKSETSLSGDVSSSPRPSAPLWDEQLPIESSSAPNSPQKGLPPFGLPSVYGNYVPPDTSEGPPTYSITVGTRYNPENDRRRGSGSPQERDSPTVEQTVLDSDGLGPVVDPLQQRLCEIAMQFRSDVERHVAENKELKRQVAELKQRLVRDGTSDQFDVLDDLRDTDEIFNIETVEGPSSFDDSHWEKVQEKDAQAVLWVPDHASTHCFGCNSQFWLAKRRHHCRSCGRLFCYSCSNFYCPVPDEQLYEPVRVCFLCYDKLDGHGYNERHQQRSIKAAA